uniref:Cytosolic carboxypeptidase-like protein 5 n=1 Tax=Schistocephalus solidus TaxID=70667 RepID=A0A0X3PN12_SCHSO
MEWYSDERRGKPFSNWTILQSKEEVLEALYNFQMSHIKFFPEKGVSVREKADQDFLSVFENNLGVDDDLRLQFITYCKGNHLADPQLLQIPSEESNVQCYIDLHGHCTKRGCFCYGNFLKSEKSMMDNIMYARLIALNSAFFDFGGCNFSARNMYQKDRSTAQSKEGSGRVAVAKHMGLTHCYTIEANYNSGRLVNILPPAAGDNRCATPPGFLFGPMRRDLKRNANDAMNCYLNFQHATHPVMFMEYGAYVLNTSTSFAIPHYEEMGRGLLIAALDMWCTNPWSRLANCPCADMLKLKPGTHKTLRALTSPLNSANKYPLSGQKLRMAESVNYKLLRNWARRHTTHLANHEGITFSRKESEPRSQKHDVRLPTTGRSAVLEVVPLTRLRGRNNAPSKTTTEIVCVTPVSTDQPQIRETTDVALHRRIDDPSNITPEIICETPVSTEKSNPWSSIEPEVPAKSRQIDANELTADSVRNQSQSSQKDLKTQCTTSSFLIMPTKRKKLVNGDIAQNAPDGGEPAPKMNHKTVEFFCDGGKAMSENEHSCQSHASLLPEPSPRIRQGQCERRASLRSDFGVPRPSFSPRMPDLEFGFDASKVVRPLLQRPSRWESGKTPKPRSEKQCGKAPEPGPSEGRTVLLSRRGSLPARSPHPNKLVALEPPKRCLEKPTPRKVNSSTNNARKSTLDSHSTNIRPTVASVVIKSLDGGMVAYKGLAELDRREINRMLRKTDSCQPKIAHPKVAKRASSRNLAITAYTKREQPKPTAKSPGLIRDRTVNAFSTAPLDGKRKTLKRSKSNLAPRSRQQPSAVNANATPLERLTPAFTPRTLRLRRTTHLPRLKSTEPPAFPSITTGPVWTNIY